MDKKTGIVGLTGSFGEAVADLPEGSKVVFTGSAALCTPFIELPPTDQGLALTGFHSHVIFRSIASAMNSSNATKNAVTNHLTKKIATAKAIVWNRKKDPKKSSPKVYLDFIPW